jgi:hypothetical protein
VSGAVGEDKFLLSARDRGVAWNEKGAAMGTKGRLGFFLAAFSAVSWVPLAPAQEFRRGDATVDGRVDMADVACMLAMPFFLCDLRCARAADADGNGAVNITDAVRILNVLFLGIGEIPLPGPSECGFGIEPSDLGCLDYPPALCAGPPPPPLDPRFEMRIDSPAGMRGPPGGMASVEAIVQLCNEVPVLYWSLGVTADGCEIVAATTDGTLAAPVAQGGLSSSGFAKSEVIDPAKNGGRKGAVSAIILSLIDPTTLPATGGIGPGCAAPNEVLRLTVSAPVPDGPSGSCILAFTDGLTGSGQPVGNLVGRATDVPSTARPSLTGATISVEEGTFFLRGDAGADGETTISDAIRILDFLFTGDTVLACRDAADTDDSGEIDITDPIRLLGFLFLGQGEIPAPADTCGVDPTEDALGCGEYDCA